jgi:hypothetical protein
LFIHMRIIARKEVRTQIAREIISGRNRKFC